jgi:ADP-ribosylglycohydrolase
VSTFAIPSGEAALGIKAAIIYDSIRSSESLKKDEAMRETRLFSKIYGCILGGAIGDAFGILTENMHYRDIERQHGRVTRFESLPRRKQSEEPPVERFYPHGKGWENVDGYHPLGRWGREVGIYTDDMRYKLLLCHTIIEKRRPVTGDDFAEAWMNYRMMAEGASDHTPTLSWKGPEKAYARITASTRRVSRMSCRHRAAVLGWDAPIGLIHAGDPEAAAVYGNSMAIAVASALSSKATFDSVVKNILRYAEYLSSEFGILSLADEFTGRVEKLVEIASSKDVFALREPIYREFFVTYPPWNINFVLEMIPCALALCRAAKDDAELAIIGAVNLGRDADTIASIVGEIMGSLYGFEAFPAEWRRKVESLNPEPDMAGMAEELCRIIKDRADADRKRAEDLLSMSALDE